MGDNQSDNYGWRTVKLGHTKVTPEHAEITRLRAELETERMRLVACGVVALADTPESAATARQMHDSYRSGSLDDVIRRVDECMRLRADYEGACKTIAEMHAAAMGQTVGPVRGVVEDVADLRLEADRLRAEVARLEGELEAARRMNGMSANSRALDKLQSALRIPVVPWPDPGAHSHQALGRAIHASFVELRWAVIHAISELVAPDIKDAAMAKEGGHG